MFFFKSPINNEILIIGQFLFCLATVFCQYFAWQPSNTGMVYFKRVQYECTLKQHTGNTRNKIYIYSKIIQDKGWIKCVSGGPLHHGLKIPCLKLNQTYKSRTIDGGSKELFYWYNNLWWYLDNVSGFLTDSQSAASRLFFYPGKYCLIKICYFIHYTEFSIFKP